MSDTGIKIDVRPTGFDQARRRLQKLSHFDLRDLLDNIGAVVESQVRRRIMEEKESPDGTPWAPLSEKYAKRKKKVSSGGLLELHHYLLDSITHNPVGDTVEIGSNLDYAATHQFGSEDGTTPARPYLGLSDDDSDEVTVAISTWFQEVMAS